LGQTEGTVIDGVRIDIVSDDDSRIIDTLGLGALRALGIHGFERTIGRAQKTVPDVVRIGKAPRDRTQEIDPEVAPGAARALVGTSARTGRVEG